MRVINKQVIKQASVTMIIIKTIESLSCKQWDDFVITHDFGWITHLSGWKRVIEKCFPHIRSHGFSLVNNSSNSITGGLPFYSVKSKLLGNRLISIPFATICDPLVSNTDEMTQLLNAAKAYLDTGNIFKYLEIKTLLSSSYLHDDQFAHASHFKHHFISLQKTPDELIKTFNRTCVRQRIGRALKSHFTISCAHDEAGVRAFYKLYLLTRKRVALPPMPYIFIKSLWEEFAENGLLSILLVRRDRVTIGGALIFKFKNRVSVEFAATDEQHKGYSPMHFLFWNIITKSYEEKYEIVDFGRTSAFNAGLMKFKSQWGTQVMDFQHFFYPASYCGTDESQQEESISKRALSFISKHSNSFLLEQLGNFCYRHLG